MQEQVSKSRFKTHALEIFRRVERTGKPVIITDRGSPTLVLNRYVAGVEDARQRLAGSVVQYDGPTEPVGDDAWDAVA